MPALYDYRIFISHAWRYGDEYDRLVSLLNSSPWFSYYNYSAPKEKPLALSSSHASSHEIAQAITAKIQRAQVVLVIGGMYTLYHDWMKYEVDEAPNGKARHCYYATGQFCYACRSARQSNSCSRLEYRFYYRRHPRTCLTLLYHLSVLSASIVILQTLLSN